MIEVVESLKRYGMERQVEDLCLEKVETMHRCERIVSGEARCAKRWGVVIVAVAHRCSLL